MRLTLDRQRAALASREWKRRGLSLLEPGSFHRLVTSTATRKGRSGSFAPFFQECQDLRRQVTIVLDPIIRGISGKLLAVLIQNYHNGKPVLRRIAVLLVDCSIVLPGHFDHNEHEIGFERIALSVSYN